MAEKSSKRKKLLQNPKVNEFFRSLIWALVVVFFIRSFIVEPFKIPTPSMVPTLKIGDHIFVTKFNFSLGIPFTKIKLIKFSEPKKGDVIVFLYPKNESLNYIKRVVGVPGDTVEIKDRKLYVNGEPILMEKMNDKAILTDANSEYQKEMVDLYQEHLNPQGYTIMHDNDTQNPLSFSYVFPPDGDGTAQKIPPLHYLVMGDNRDHSLDSRYWGLVPYENIKGKALMIWLSLNPEESIFSLNKIRWNRFGNLIR